VRLKPWQWVVLVVPIAAIAGFLLVSAAWQIHQWGINWIWGIVILLFVGWRWLLVKWTQPMVQQVEGAIAELEAEAEISLGESDGAKQVETELQKILEATGDDLPIWEDLPQFWQRCQELTAAIAHIYHPEVKYPLLNIYIPQAYGLIRGTVDDLDRWMQKLSPVLGQVTVGQAYEAYETYRKLEPSARKLWRAWNWAQWLLNPAAAAAKAASRRSSSKAERQLLANFGQLLREAALRNLCQQSIALYGGETLLPSAFAPAALEPPKAKTQTLQEILERAEPTDAVAQKPVNLLLVGRTGAGKSSLINTLFQSERAEVDVLPSTDRVRSYRWQSPGGDVLTLWDTPGYEQVNQGELRDLVLDCALQADLLLLVTPALDPALQMDADFLGDLKAGGADSPAIAIVTQVDRLRPLREWEPPYDWQGGDRAKEKNMREAIAYRAQLLGESCDRILPLVTADRQAERGAWGVDALSLAVMEAIAPAKQLRLARFLRDREARTVAAAQIIDRYTVQMTTTQGLTALLKSPVLQFISTLTTGSPSLAYLLAEQIPVEQLPVVIGKLQMAYDLFSVLSEEDAKTLEEKGSGEKRQKFDLLALWPLLATNTASPDREAWAFGHALVEYWTNDLAIAQLQQRVKAYLEQG